MLNVWNFFLDKDLELSEGFVELDSTSGPSTSRILQSDGMVRLQVRQQPPKSPGDIQDVASEDTSFRERPWEDFKLLCFTWNLGDARPKEEELEHWLPQDGGDFDLVVVGVQEAGYSGWEPVTAMSRSRRKRKTLRGATANNNILTGAVEELKDLLSPSSSRDVSTYPKCRDMEEQAFSFHWDDIIAERLGDSFVRVQQAVLLHMRLLVFARLEYCDGSCQWQGGSVVHSVKTTCSSTGMMGGKVGNKGGLVVSLSFGPTSLCFVSCHLAAHLEMVNKRDSDCEEILQETRSICHPRLDVTSQFDHCFWMGDLNYRIDLNQSCVMTNQQSMNSVVSISSLGSRLSVDKSRRFTDHEEHWDTISFLASQGNIAELLSHDQLLHHREVGRSFAGFIEGTPEFVPTYKVERKAGIDYATKRFPAYCDRILWKDRKSVV